MGTGNGPGGSLNLRPLSLEIVIATIMANKIAYKAFWRKMRSIFEWIEFGFRGREADG